MPTINVGPGSALELQAIADTMGKSKKVVVVTGAGISTNCGIPDFRSENGLYSLIQNQYDIAKQNPPWENKDNYDIDDRPKKKRRPWFYEVVGKDGTVVDVIDDENKASEETPPLPLPPTSTTSTPPRSKISSPDSSPLSSPPPFSPTDSSSAETATPPSEQTDDCTTASSQSSRPDLPNLKGRDLFDSMVWKDAFTTSIFYMFISSLRQRIQEVATLTPTHHFLKTLHNGGRLVRNYTQNIDCFEERLGLCSDLSSGPGSKTRFNARVQRERFQLGDDSPISTGVQVVQLHGSLSKLRCGLCLKLCAWEECERATTIGSGQAPDCPSCTEYNARRTDRGRRGLAVGRLRPDIVLYGEEHPHANLVGPLVTHDLALGPDILLILGTSLKVHGLKVIVKEFAKTVHDRGGKVIFVNRTKPPESTWGDIIDYWVGWDCDSWVLDLKERKRDIWLPPGSLQEEPKSRRQSSGDTKSTTKKARPQAIRDDRQSGVFHTFKILDTLRQMPDSKGDLAARKIYYQDLRRQSGATRDVPQPHKKITDSSASANYGSSSNTSRSKTKAPARSKSSSTRKPLPDAKALVHTANISKKRKSYPAAVPADSLDYWGKLRELAPSLSEHPSQIILDTGRMPLQELHDNMPQHLKPFSFGFPNFSDAYRKSSPNHLPDMPGLDMPNLMPNLLTHPPSGLTIPMHTPRKPPPRTTHAYGTRSSQRWSVDDNTIIVHESMPSKPNSRPSWGSNESTIVVATPIQEPTPPDSAQESTPECDSDPMTPSSQRIKRMGSIGAILSSPETGTEVFEDAKESPDVFYDANSE